MRALALALLLPASALAHQASISYGELRPRGREVDATLRFALADLRTQLRIEDPLHPPAAALSRLLLESYALKASGRACALQPDATAAPDGEDGIALHARFICPVEAEEIQVRAGFLEYFPPGHTHLARIEFGAGELSQRVAQRDDPSFEARRARSPGREFGRFLLLGIEHIFTGYDHLAFLVGLLLLGGSLRAMVGIVTAFTVAHSITLALAALDLLSPSPRVIEPSIAASILFVGGENLWALRRGTAAAALRHRWVLTFLFGLVHGFGFAAVLRGMHLPRSALASGLLSFNLGVEVGQVCIVVIALPLLSRLGRLRPFAPAASFCVAGFGALLLIARLAS
jgi:hydrogenase/urease accessory protein HupE